MSTLAAVAAAASPAMPSLARKILIVAAIDGLVLTPLHHPNSRSTKAPTPPPGAVRIDYKTKQILPHIPKPPPPPTDATDPATTALEAHGIAGLLNVSPTSAYLIAITSHSQVALVRSHPIYVVTSIALIPLSSQSLAEEALAKARPRLTHTAETDTESDTESDDVDSARSSIEAERISGAGEDVIGRKGLYGRFAEKWFSKRGWTAEQRRAEGMSAEEGAGSGSGSGVQKAGERKNGEEGGAHEAEEVDVAKPENRPAPDTGDAAAAAAAGDAAETKAVAVAKEAVKEDVAHNLTPKLLHTTKLLLGGSQSFFFSYDWDVTRSWATQEKGGGGEALHRRVDPLYFWNHHLQKPFIDAHQDHLVLPLMQGFVGQVPITATKAAAATPAPATAPPPADGEEPDTATPAAPSTFEALLPDQQDFTLTLISRRSTRRAGLRYLRRGTDDSGHVANAVETEQLLADATWTRVFSYLQFRGSIPLFFQQSPYALKPKPVLLRSPEANTAALTAHFKRLVARYGHVHAINLVEKHGNEAVLGAAYDSALDALASAEGYPIPGPAVTHTWFDFHHECRGMRFSNVHRLLAALAPTLADHAYTETDGPRRLHTQAGVLRTNCMDCLDRTNVVQSAAALHTLRTQLSTLRLAPASETPFNTLWADNGDAISKQYASTAALKGDFTRTRTRNYRGALTDLGLTLSRYWTNIITDFFTQAALDFLLGSVTSSVFAEFETALSSSDPAISLSTLRSNAIATASHLVLEDPEERVRHAYTLLAPADQASLRSLPFTEVVLLVTEKALYRVAFDWATEKVREFSRVPLEEVEGVQWGAYVTSTLSPAGSDERRNVGVLVRYRDGAGRVRRVNTRSVGSWGAAGDKGGRFWAFKALPGQGEKVGDVCRGIEEVWKESVKGERVGGEAKGVDDREEEGGGKTAEEGKGKKVDGEEDGFVVNKDIISLAEAKKSTGLLEQWGYNLRKSIWT